MTPVALESCEFDVLVIGSGFGGSVAAMRLSQKGYRVGMLEKGRRYRAEDFPKSNWRLRKFIWAPLLRCFGFQGIRFLKGAMVLHGVGVGGGSLVYANTLMKPLSPVMRDPGWPEGRDWEAELEPHFAEARRMLGVTRNPKLALADETLKKVGAALGIESTFHPTEVGVFFGEPGVKVHDPYFGGEGPERAGCNLCGGCMVGCRHRAKNTLDYNYLYFAEKKGVKVIPETEATRITPLGGSSGYQVETRSSTSLFRARGPAFRAKRVILAAGVLGTLDLLFRNRDRYGTLPDLSPTLGFTVRTNGESLVGATRLKSDRDYSAGIAIGSAIHPDQQTKVEVCRYPAGSDAMRLLAVPLTGPGNRITRPLKMLVRGVVRLPRMIRLVLTRDWAKNTMILLVMQSVDQKMKLVLKRSGLAFAAAENPIPSYLPIAQKAALETARIVEGEPQNAASEVLLGSVATAHILGGCCMGEDPSRGVVDSKHEVFGYPGLFVCDGSVIPVNLAVNPSLTITALAERFASLWPKA